MSGAETAFIASMAPAATASAVPAVLGTTAMLAPPIAIGLGNQAAMGVAASGAATKATVGSQIANLAASQTPILNPMMIGNASSATSPFLTQGALANVSAPATSPFMQGLKAFGNNLNNPALRLAQSLNVNRPQDRMEVRSMRTQPQSANFFRDNQNVMAMQTVPAGRGRLEDEMTLFGRGLL